MWRRCWTNQKSHESRQRFQHPTLFVKKAGLVGPTFFQDFAGSCDHGCRSTNSPEWHCMQKKTKWTLQGWRGAFVTRWTGCVVVKSLYGRRTQIKKLSLISKSYFLSRTSCTIIIADLYESLHSFQYNQCT